MILAMFYPSLTIMESYSRIIGTNGIEKIIEVLRSIFNISNVTKGNNLNQFLFGYHTFINTYSQIKFTLSFSKIEQLITFKITAVLDVVEHDIESFKSAINTIFDELLLQIGELKVRMGERKKSHTFSSLARTTVLLIFATKLEVVDQSTLSAITFHSSYTSQKQHKSIHQ